VSLLPSAFVGRSSARGIWDLRTKRVIWDGDGAVAIAWFPEGDEIAVIRLVMSEFVDWSFDRLRWPERELVASCPITSWIPDFRTVAVSPLADLAVVGWGHQVEAGLILVDVAEGGATQVEGVKWDTENTNWLSVPGWDPDASTVAVFENPRGASNWWGGDHDEDPSPGGEFVVSTLVVLGRDLKEISRTPVRVALPDGWLPAGDDDRGISEFHFESADVVTVKVPLLGEQRMSLSDLH